MRLRLKVRQRVENDESLEGSSARARRFKLLLETPGGGDFAKATVSLDDMTGDEADMFMVGDFVDLVLGTSSTQTYDAVKADRDRLAEKLRTIESAVHA